MLSRQAENLPEGLADSAVRIQEGAERAFKFVDGFLLRTAADRIEVPVRMAEVDLAECVDTIVRNHLDHANRKDISVVWEKPGARLLVRTDPSAFGEALENLISNAIKFSPHGSSVFVSLDEDGRTVRVRDEGPGFTDDDKEQLYERFVRLSAKPTGSETSTGLGLSIVKNAWHRSEESCSARAKSGREQSSPSPSVRTPSRIDRTPQANSLAIGVPRSVIGTGRSPA